MIKFFNTIRGFITSILVAVALIIICTGYYGASLYRASYIEQQELSQWFSDKLSAAYSLQNKYLSHAHEWKTILLRGQDSEQYYIHLKKFYALERNIRSDVDTLKQDISGSPEPLQLLTKFETSYRQLGRDYRNAIKAYNDTIENPHIIADSLTNNSELPEQIIADFVNAMNNTRKIEILTITNKIKKDEINIITFLLLVTLSSFLFVLIIIQRKLALPIKQATSIAKKITEGDFNHSVKNWHTSSEITQLLNTLMVMQATIKTSQEALIHEREISDNANQAKSEFLSSMSHELRTPMNAILGFSQILEIDETLNSEQRESISEILRAGHHLLELINEVLDLTKIEEGKLEINIEEVSLSRIMASSLSLIAPQAQQRNITLINKALEYTDYIALADPLRLKQVFINLLSNAVKYNYKGGSVSINVELNNQDKIRLSVIDSGAGISADKIDKLFIPFERLGYEGDLVEGTGIGLALSKRMLDLMNGLIGVESKPNMGSTFFIELPFVKTTEIHQINRTQSNASDKTNSETQAFHQNEFYKILYIEDNPASLRLMDQVLRPHENIELISAHTGSLGLEMIFSHNPDLIILDINLPGISGLEILKNIKNNETTKSIPVIALSANAMPNDISAGLKAGFDDYLIKPLNIIRFNQVLEHYSTLTR